MEKTIYYSSIKKIIYKFSEYEIRDLLIKSIKDSLANSKINIEFCDDSALVTVMFEQVKKGL